MGVRKLFELQYFGMNQMALSDDLVQMELVSSAPFRRRMEQRRSLAKVMLLNIQLSLFDWADKHKVAPKVSTTKAVDCWDCGERFEAPAKGRIIFCMKCRRSYRYRYAECW